jgi:hypothetical protein
MAATACAQERTNARAFNAGCRIDYVLASPGLLPHIESCEILYDLPRKVCVVWTHIRMGLGGPGGLADGGSACELCAIMLACHINWHD